MEGVYGDVKLEFSQTEITVSVFDDGQWHAACHICRSAIIAILRYGSKVCFRLTHGDDVTLTLGVPLVEKLMQAWYESL